jgi:hypothetical protein
VAGPRALLFSTQACLDRRVHKARHIMPELPGGKDDAEGRYANYFQIGFNAYEFILDFGQQYPPDAERIHTRIVTSPPLARSLLETLERSLRDHDREYGQRESVSERHDREH